MKNQGARFTGLHHKSRGPRGPGRGFRVVAGRFIRMLKERLLWVRSFDTIEGLRQALIEFKERFNKHWLLQRHGYTGTTHPLLAEAA